MTQTTNRFLDELAKLMTDAAGAADGLKREVTSLMRAQAERLLHEMDVVQREEFEAVKAMAEKARAENERLEARIAALEARLAAREAGFKLCTRKRARLDVIPVDVGAHRFACRKMAANGGQAQAAVTLAVDNDHPQLATRTALCFRRACRRLLLDLVVVASLSFATKSRSDAKRI